ncbi:hypothetical protein [Nocardioides sp.]|uniref:hypothetical protein n=1 Tax=Nocardioides sp. TaxID=35761 RepID=UPI0039E4E98D
MMSLSRRAVPGLLVGAAAALTGCDLLPADDPAPVPAPTADELLVDAVAAQLLAARNQALAVAGGESYAALHDAHLVALGRPAAPGTPLASPTTLPSGAVDAGAALVAVEQGLRTALADGAVSAEDGSLARLLASMSAAVAQLVHGAAA